jgi:hypothetical protein
MSRWLLFESERQIIVKVIRMKSGVKIIIYHYNLGAVHKEIYKEEKREGFSYLSVNRDELVKKNQEVYDLLKGNIKYIESEQEEG